MKTISRFKLILGVSLVAIIGLISLNSFTTIKDNKAIVQQSDSVNITIDSDTSDKELDDIRDMLKEHGISVKFNNIKRNEDKLITGIKIELKDENGNSAVSQTSSTNPIQTFSFGRKNGSLYVSQGKGGFGNFAFFGDDMDFDFDHDSIFKLHFNKLDSLNFDHIFKFDDEDNIMLFNGKSFDMDELKDHMNNMFILEEDEDSGKKRIIIKGGNGNHFFFDGDEDHELLEWHSDKDEHSNHKKHQKFRFVDNPKTEKLIVIDGKDSDFKTLDDLAKNDKLESVDVLKSNTAMSIYGKKAKDGAIIATTK